MEERTTVYKKSTKLLMTISGITGLILFGIANFTSIFVGSSEVAGLLQFVVNAFVAISWCKGFIETTGWRKWFAVPGIVIPFIMASITFYRVFLPYIFS